MSKSINDATKRGYDGTVARIAGNVASGLMNSLTENVEAWEANDNINRLAAISVGVARAIVAETKRTEPGEDPQP